MAASEVSRMPSIAPTSEIVYKYISSNRIQILESGLIRFTQPAALNDPFETLPNLDEMRAHFSGRAEYYGRKLDRITAVATGILANKRIENRITHWLQELSET